MSNAAVLATPDEPTETEAEETKTVQGIVSWLPAMTPADARRLAVALLLEAEEISPAPKDVGPLPFGWRRLSLIVPTLEDAPVVELVRSLKREGLGRGRIADELNSRGLTTQTGGPWHRTAIARLERIWPEEQRRRWSVPTAHRLL